MHAFIITTTVIIAHNCFVYLYFGGTQMIIIWLYHLRLTKDFQTKGQNKVLTANTWSKRNMKRILAFEGRRSMKISFYNWGIVFWSNDEYMWLYVQWMDCSVEQLGKGSREQFGDDVMENRWPNNDLKTWPWKTSHCFSKNQSTQGLCWQRGASLGWLSSHQVLRNGLLPACTSLTCLIKTIQQLLGARHWSNSWEFSVCCRDVRCSSFEPISW